MPKADTKLFCPQCQTPAIRDSKAKQLSCPKCKKQPNAFIGVGYNFYAAELNPERTFPDDFPMDPKYCRHQDF